MANPAAVYCSELGYNYTIIKTNDGGEQGICILPDKTECEEWQFFEGKCGLNYSYCEKHGYNIETVKDGKNSFSPEYAVCIINNSLSSGTPIKASMAKEKIAISDLMNLTQKLSIKIKPLLSTEVNQPKTANNVMSAPLVSSTSIPTSFDWRNVNGSNWVTPIKDQGQCGSCWAFAAIGSVEAKINIANNNPNLDPELSEEDMIACSGGGSCSGGWSDIALNYIKNNGTVDDYCFPYSLWTYLGLTPSCSNKCSNWNERLWKIDKFGYVPHLSYEDYNQTMKRYLIEKGPLITYLNFEGYFDNGIYRCSSSEIDHAVVVVGYNDTGNYWIIKNSWGTWLDRGYYKVGYGECGIEPDKYVDLYSKKDLNISNAFANLGDVSGTLNNTYYKDGNYISFGDNCYFGGCNGLQGYITIPVTNISEISSMNIITYDEGTTSNFELHIWNGTWKDYGKLPTSWNLFKYNLCKSPAECSNYVYNGNVYVEYYHPSCILCGKNYANVDFLNLEITSMPKITISSPLNNGIYGSGNILLNVSTVDVSKLIKISLDSVYNTFNDIDSVSYYLSSLPEGIHTLTVYADNYDDNENSKTITFIVDKTAPQELYFNINNTNPKSNETIKISSKWLDNYNLSYYIFGWNESGYWTYDTPVFFTSNPDWANITKTIPMNDEGKTIAFTLSVYDSVGNYYGIYNTIQVKDITPPTITIYSPWNTTYNSNTVLLNAYIGETAKWIKTSVDNGSNNTCSDCYYLTYNLTSLSEGNHFVTVYASDYAGNENKTTVYFSVDTVPPKIFITTDKYLINNTGFQPPFNINVSILEGNLNSVDLYNIQDSGNENIFLYSMSYDSFYTNFTGNQFNFSYSWNTTYGILGNDYVSVSETSYPVIGKLMMIQGFFKKNNTIEPVIVSALFDSNNKSLELLSGYSLQYIYISKRLFDILQNDPYNIIPKNVTYDQYKTNFTVEPRISTIKGVLMYYNGSIASNTSEVTFTGEPENGYNVKLGEKFAPDSFYNIIVSASDKSGNTNQSNITLQINTTPTCIPNWILNAAWSNCLINDTQYKNYYDSNSCNKTESKPPNLVQSCDYCTPSWSCNNYGSCQTNDKKLCSSVNDNNNCFAQTGLTSDKYSGDYSEFTLACDFCTPNWQGFNTTCQPGDKMTEYYLDLNSCFNQTGLASDLIGKPSNITYACDFCIPNWILNDNPCELGDKKLITYTDVHNCNETDGLPLNNGTYVSCDYCTPNWILNATWSQCYANDTQYKNYYDSKNCNETDTKPSDEMQSCDFCTPNWMESNTTCQPDDKIIGYFVDGNDCYNKTNLLSDLTGKPTNITYTCDYCTPSWILNDTWSECEKLGIQFKNYYDGNDCNENEGKPENINQTCEYIPEHTTSQNIINLTANEEKQIDSINENTSIQIVTGTNVTNGNINISKYVENPKSSIFGVKELNKFISIEVSPEINQNLLWALIKIYYSHDELNGIDENSLKIYYYNSTTDSWTPYNPPYGGVNTTENYIWANTTHFSYYGAGGLLVDGQSCNISSDCNSNNCAVDNDGSGKWCAPSGNCAHDAVVTYASGSTTCYNSNKETCNNGIWTSESCSYGCSSGNCNSAPAPQYSGGGGGGAPPTCKENWTCTDWSTCILDKQTRLCTDKNKCGTTKSKPIESQSCTVFAQTTKNCTEDWSCNDWSDCVNNTQTRTCTDKNSCGTVSNKPVESHACTLEKAPSAATTAPTGLFLGLTTTEWMTAIVAGIIVACIIIYGVLKVKKKKTIT
jgi:C1A family cysteine protease